MTGTPHVDPVTAHPVTDRLRRDWSARARASGFDALRYSKFVVLMKRATTLGAAAVIGAVLLFFFMQRQPRQLSLSYEKMGNVQDDLAMIKPRLTGADAHGNPFVITADAAIQDAHNPKKATLRKVEADLAIGQQSWIDARAAAGMVDMTAHKLALSGGIDMFTDTGYQLHSQTAFADLKTNIITGPDEATGQGPLGTLRADHFRYDRNAGLLTLEGHVHITMTGKPR